MTIEYDDKGKYYTDIVKKLPLPVVIQTTAHLVRGFVHVREGERLKNELEREEAFLRYPGVRIWRGGQGSLHHAVHCDTARADRLDHAG